MLGFVARAFRSWMAFILWAIIILSAIIGSSLGGLAGGEYAPIFLLLGGFIGLINAILFGGFIANFLKIADNIEEQTKLLRQQMGLSTSNIVPSNDPASYDWVCKKCDKTNRKTALFCNNCGEKK